MNKAVAITIGSVILSAVIAWGAWNTLATATAVPSSEFTKHKDDANDKFTDILKEIQEQRIGIEKKLDDIQEKL